MRTQIQPEMSERRIRSSKEQLVPDQQSPQAHSSSSLAWQQELPPIPSADPGQRLQERFGLSLVAGASSLVVVAAELCASFLAPSAVTRVPATVAELATVSAACCLFAIRSSTSAVLQRTHETALPIPEAVAAALAGKADMPVSNIVEGDGRSYCVRCFVWRPKDVECHHCRVCQRCTVHFDHHCHILGRCIGGAGLRGNLLPFRVLLASTAVGVLSCFITLIVAILTLLNPDGQSESLTASLSTGARTALGLGALAAMGAVIILGCWVVSRLCDGARQLTERSRGLDGRGGDSSKDGGRQSCGVELRLETATHLHASHHRDMAIA